MSTHARFAAFGSYGFVAVRDPGVLTDVLDLVRTVVADVDATCSRFREDSDLSRVNRRPGEWVEVHPLLVEAVRVAYDAAAASDGLVDPLLGRPLVTLGYDRDFGELIELAWSPTPAPATPTPGAWRRIDLDEDRIRIPGRTALDLGSTAKAWAADLAAAAIETELDEPAVVSLGGDIRIASPDGQPWPIAVSEHRDDIAGGRGTVVELSAGGLATSSTRVRRWTRGGTTRHHLLDPRTGLPAAGVWRTVTATGPTCVAANTASTAAVVLGTAAEAWLSARHVTARLVGRHGRVVRVGGWPVEHLEEAAS